MNAIFTEMSRQCWGQTLSTEQRQKIPTWEDSELGRYKAGHGAPEPGPGRGSHHPHSEDSSAKQPAGTGDWEMGVGV